MRVVLSLSTLLLAAAAAPAGQMVVTSPGVAHAGDRFAALPKEAVCRDRIDLVREDRGLPKIDRGTATEDEGLLIAAVDHRIDGCSVMVMRNDTSDVRPLPAPAGQGRLQRIPGQ